MPIAMGEILPSNFAKCCFRYDLIIGCAVYVTVEIYLWAILSLASNFSEFKMIENRDVGAFKNFTLSSSYYVTAFGHPSDEIGRSVIFTQIVINAIFSVGFLLYWLFAVILLIGISEKNTAYFGPYLYLDTLFLYLSFIGIFVAVFIQNKVAFRNALIFALKFYPSSCIYSLYKKIGGESITLSSYTSLAHRHTPLNPAAGIARSDTELEGTPNKSSSECLKPKVSFQSVTEEFSQSPLPTHNVSSQSMKHLSEVTILKPCFRKSLQLPINNSYP